MANRKIKMDLKNLLRFLIESTPVDTGRKLNVHKTFRRRLRTSVENGNIQ